MSKNDEHWFWRKKNHFFPKNLKGWAFSFLIFVLVVLIFFRFQDHYQSKDIFLGLSLIIAIVGFSLQFMHKKSHYLVEK